MIPQLECVKCGVHYILTEHCTPTKCPICTAGIDFSFPSVDDTVRALRNMAGKAEFGK